MATDDEDPTGWEEIDRLIGCVKDGPRFWGEVAGDVEALVSPHGTIVLCKEYRSRGMGLEHPWIELTEAELQGVLSRGDELLRAIADERKRRR